MTLLRNLFLAACLAMAPVAVAFAHGPAPAPQHGGQVQEIKEHWVELVLRGDQILVYVSDSENKPLPSNKVSGKATILIGTEKADVVLAPAEGNSLAGKLPKAAEGKATAVLALTIDGKAGTARYALG